MTGNWQAAAGVFAATSAGMVHAQAIDPDPRFWLEAGVYTPKAETELSLSLPDAANGTRISLEDDLGFTTDATSFDVTLGAKLDDDFFLETSLFDIARTSTAELAGPITVEDATYDVGASVDSRFASDILRVSVGYRIAAKQEWDLAVLIGAHVTQFDFAIDGEARVNGQTATTLRRERDVLAPLPTIGVQAQYRPARWLQLRARADYFELDIGKYDGRLTNLEVSTTTAVTRNLALGAAWRSTEYRLGVDDENYAAQVQYLLDGVRLFARLTL
ncbi:MAG: hypothetical protein NXH71_02090 [Erythrobacteraceae bacterium]|jgi:hypothetical protein|nr:hypothetical protein [Erythrobacteraceae bacterium]